MKSGNTRAAAAATSRKVKQELIRALFGPQLSQGPRDRVKGGQYSYSELRKEYLQRLQELHPDKYHRISGRAKKESQAEFVSLQEAWNRYETMAKQMRKVGSNKDEEEASFTMFGVGCSFADSEAERARRTEIMDQAGRGWFSAGLLKETFESETVNGKGKEISLMDDDMFTVVENVEPQNEIDSPKSSTSNEKVGSRKSLLVSLPRRAHRKRT